MVLGRCVDFRRYSQALCVGWLMPLVVTVLLAVTGCTDKSQDRARRTQQRLDEAKTQSDALRDALRYLEQMTPLNRSKMQDEVQLHLNKWWQTADKQAQSNMLPILVDGLPPDLRAEANFAMEGDGQFDTWDIEYLFQCRLCRQLATWVVQQPLRDSLLQPWLDAQAKTLPSELVGQLEQGLKLFDWSIRNVVLMGNAKDVERLIDDPRKPAVDTGFGYHYLPWQTILYGRGDFVERGRAFMALAKQRGLEVCWVALRLPTSPAAKLWTVGLWIGDECYLFDPQLGLPIIDSDSVMPATLAQVQQNAQILRRLDVPGRFDYAVNPGDARQPEFLLDIEPSAGTQRMAVLQASLAGDDRLVLQPELQPLVDKLQRVLPDSPVACWQVPLLARLFAIDLRNRLTMNSTFTAQYMYEHAVWYMETPLATARLKHLLGDFESTLDGKGAWEWYMACRLGNDLIDRLPDDPDVQAELQIPRLSIESLDEYQGRLRQMQMVLRQSKIDASFLLGQSHFDKGNMATCRDWMGKWTLNNASAAKWHPAARYVFARALEQEGKLPKPLRY